MSTEATEIERIEIGEFSSINHAQVLLGGFEIGSLALNGINCAKGFDKAFQQLKKLAGEPHKRFTREVDIKDVEPETEFDLGGTRYVMLFQDDKFVEDMKKTGIFVYEVEHKRLAMLVREGLTVKVTDDAIVGTDQSHCNRKTEIGIFLKG